MVGIGMPVFNGERFIEEAIESLLAQTFEDFELVIVDNHSTDRTLRDMSVVRFSRSSCAIHQAAPELWAQPQLQ